MSKRRNRSEVPQETIERARQQAADAPQDVPQARSSAPVQRVTERRSQRRDGLQERDLIQSRKRKAKRDEMTMEEIEELLENPTKEVSEEQLRAQYTYVAADLRSMGLLAAALMGLLVLLAQVLPR